MSLPYCGLAPFLVNGNEWVSMRLYFTAFGYPPTCSTLTPFVGGTLPLQPLYCAAKYCETKEYACPETRHVTRVVVASREEDVVKTAPSIPVGPQPSPRVSLQTLVHARGAQGRGSRALLRALYRRTKALIKSDDPGEKMVYVEFCASYVRATDHSTGRLSRFAVERRAWPEFRAVLGWEEVKTAEARQRGAVLRRLRKGERYGRHLFITSKMLGLAVDVAEQELDLTDADANDGIGYGGMTEVPDFTNEGRVEHIIKLRRMPVPQLRSVSAHCPRRSSHKNGDRNPSLILWMNRDGLTGGALCPVCFEDHGPGPEGRLRNRTWQVRYLPNQQALLCAPRCRARNHDLAVQKMGEQGQSLNDRGSNCVEGLKSLHPLHRKNNQSFYSKAHSSTLASNEGPVGGFVLRDMELSSQVGLIPSLAYVVAKLKTVSSTSSSKGEPLLPWNEDCVGDGVLVRTIGRMSHRSCPLRIMMWSDKCSLKSGAAHRASEMSWYAAETAALDSSMGSRPGGKVLGNWDDPGGELDSRMWLPTDVLSVSAMRPSGWRQVRGTSGDITSVPTGWEPSVQKWVVFDLDDVCGLEGTDEDIFLTTDISYSSNQGGVPLSVASRAASAMMRVIRRSVELSGVCMVLQSGPRGLHVWAELREVRENPRGWFANTATRRWYGLIGSRLLSAARKAGVSGGHIDMSSCAAGRFSRRPGWRIRVDSGKPFRSRVVSVATSRVRNRDPRQ